jgi:hypothetical protein
MTKFMERRNYLLFPTSKCPCCYLLASAWWTRRKLELRILVDSGAADRKKVAQQRSVCGTEHHVRRWHYCSGRIHS